MRTFIDGEVVTCHEQGWSRLSNGELLDQAERQFDAFVTTDKNLLYQQRLRGRRISIFVLPTTRWPLLRSHGEVIAEAIGSLSAGDFVAWQFPS